LKFNRFFPHPAVESSGANFFHSKERLNTSSTPPLLTLYQVFRI
jgi:hypothetical protein